MAQGIRVRVKLTGAANRAEYKRMIASILPEMTRELVKQADLMLLLSKIEVPIEDQDLINSGMVNGPFGTALKQTVSISYGGPRVAAAGRGFDYALKQHDGDFNHPLGGKSHYLSEPVMAYGQQDWPTAMADAGLRAINKWAQ